MIKIWNELITILKFTLHLQINNFDEKWEHNPNTVTDGINLFWN